MLDAFNKIYTLHNTTVHDCYEVPVKYAIPHEE